MKQLITILFVLIICLTAQGQQSFGILVDGGLSKFSDNQYARPGGIQKTYMVPSGQAGLFYNIQIRKNESFEVELLFSQIEGKIHDTDTSGIFSANGTTAPIVYQTYISRHISYLSLPLLYGIKIGNFSIHIGFQASLALMSSQQSTLECNFNYQTQSLSPYSTSSSSNKLYIKDGAFGEVGKIIYNINSRLAIEGNYYYCLSNIYRNPNSTVIETIWRFQQATIGLRYKFLTTKQKDTTDKK